MPSRSARAGPDILHVEHVVLEVFVKDARLNLKRGLLILERIFQPQQGCGRFGSDVERDRQRDSPAENGDDRDHADKEPDADAHRPHGGDLAVGGEAAEAEQHPDEHGHGNGQDQHVGKHEQENFGHGAQRGAVARCHFQQLANVLHEQNESEERTPEKGMGEDFIPDIAGKNAHRRDPDRLCYSLRQFPAKRAWREERRR